jgi:trehalose 6-phosphate synthase/phosphatase
LLGVKATTKGVQLDDHFVNVISLAIGIDPHVLSLARSDLQVQHWIDYMMGRYMGKKLIVARDKLDNIRGVRQKLLAFELFLTKYPEWKDKVVLIQVVVSTADNPELSSSISNIVHRINSQFSTLAHQPLVFQRRDITFSQYLALLSVADVLMVTSLREGMNLTCHEFVICQDGSHCSKKYGTIILSQFTGSASVFKDSTSGHFDLSINPWDFQQTAKAIKSALEMNEVEKEYRYKKMHHVVVNYTGEYWVTNLNQSLAKHLGHIHSVASNNRSSRRWHPIRKFFSR